MRNTILTIAFAFILTITVILTIIGILAIIGPPPTSGAEPGQEPPTPTGAGNAADGVSGHHALTIGLLTQISGQLTEIATILEHQASHATLARDAARFEREREVRRVRQLNAARQNLLEVQRAQTEQARQQIEATQRAMQEPPEPPEITALEWPSAEAWNDIARITETVRNAARQARNATAGGGAGAFVEITDDTACTACVIAETFAGNVTREDGAELLHDFTLDIHDLAEQATRLIETPETLLTADDNPAGPAR